MLIALVVALVAPVTGASAAGESVPNPRVSGPTVNGVRPNPWNASTFPLITNGYQYREDEYTFSGTATNLSNAATAAYTSRFIIRQPVDPDDFNGIILVDWMNVTNGQDWEYNWWATAYDYAMREGYAIVAVSAQNVGVAHLRTWDPPRYASLSHPGDAYARDIFAQAMKAVRDGSHNAPNNGTVVDPLLGRPTRYLIGGGVSQSASQLIGFIDQGYNRDGLVDAWNIERALGSTPEDLSTFVFILNEETNFTGLPTREQAPDSDGLRVWEEAGVAHHPIEWWEYTHAGQMRDQSLPNQVDPVDQGCSVNRGTMGYSVRAMLHSTKVYLEDGTLPASAPRIPRNADGSLPRDADGLVEGGLRHPFIQVPVALNRSTDEDCPNWGTYQPWTYAKIRDRYPTHAEYLRLTTEWSDHQVAAGLLLPEDRNDAVARAAAFTQPWPDALASPPNPETGSDPGSAPDDSNAPAPAPDPEPSPNPLPATGGGLALLAVGALGVGAALRRR